MHPKNEAASTFLALGARRNDACDVSLVLVLGFSACVNTAKHGKWEERYFFQPGSAMIG
ncbi:uncharacterized protein FPRO_08253 [Fusarium proliferatum ET1]|uniref:Uncharacterized protein n=1 Tax=Fusarium proliferatum (strain ET1) TaxID=1227346 RepID=A0A1L7W2K0_FUSPR|nr:uncharacterized protein FPRO_08253 [Fusarium proliferatum ET1]CZR46879.1 uncharacterized protein FPRO_08253 [Fusarium proliferatum ET1]